MADMLYHRADTEIFLEHQVLSLVHGPSQIMYDLATGQFRYLYDNKVVLADVHSVAKGPNIGVVDNKSSRERTYEIQEIHEEPLRGVSLRIHNAITEELDIRQEFYAYFGKSYIVLGVDLEGRNEVESNFIAPIVAPASNVGSDVFPSDDLRILSVPFDNDKWIRYSSNPPLGETKSYEVTAIFDNQTRVGLVIGSITHDVWKTGITIKDTLNIEVYGGCADDITRDTVQHGSILAKRIESPKIFIGLFEDYRRGLEEFAKANAAVTPALKWTYGVPFGWNSWAALGSKVTYQHFLDTSDFIKDNLQSEFHNQQTVYVNFDSFWTNLTEEQLRESVKHVIANGQIPGTYLAPFAYFGRDFQQPVEGTDGMYTYHDLLLRNHEGEALPPLDGGFALDPTHPGTVMRMNWYISRFVDWGFRYLKLDFVTHAALEGVHYANDIRTGIQAYNFGMRYIQQLIDQTTGDAPFFISLSIAPLFPYQYAHSRRISCDAFGAIDQTEYMLNALTYAWWVSGNLYTYNDPDHIVLYKSYEHAAISEEEARSRFHASVIGGTVLLDSDDFRFEEARERAKTLLTNPDINQIARKGQSFVPTEGNTGDRATDVFVLDDTHRAEFYIAVFNYSFDAVTRRIDLARIGLTKECSYLIRDLWTKESVTVAGVCDVWLGPAESKMLQVHRIET